ncbi:MAG: hypothetical protein EON98_06050, partial [Chitinophagaceae bacterium]
MKVFAFCVLSLIISTLSKGQNIGIGTIAPNHPLTVTADASYKGIAQKNGSVEIGFWTSPVSAYLQTWSPHDLNFATNNGFTRLTLANATGFFGVNTTSPSAHLDVNGTFRLRGNGAAAGNILMCDINGVATWQPIGSVGGWSLTGNGGTNPSVDFLGTTDNQPLMFRQNNIYAGQFNYNLRNYFIGNQSGLNTTGRFNVAMGDSALRQNVAGNSNIAIGRGALQQSPSYSSLVAIGDSALFKNGTFNDGGSSNNCTRNTAVGAKALLTNSQGYQNTAFGFEAGYGMGLGWSNTAIGAFAMRNGGSFGAEGNVGVGVNALYNTKNLHNTGVGTNALYTNTTGSRNTAVGHSALYANLDGEHNTAIGFSALSNASSGDFNTAVGAYANTISSAITNATAIGTRAYVTQSNSVVLGA